jgi:hypothetical protein
MESGIETSQKCGEDDDAAPIREAISARTTGMDGKGVALGFGHAKQASSN